MKWPRRNGRSRPVGPGHQRSVDLLLDAGVLHADFYAACTGLHRASARQAAEHAAREGLAGGAPLHPLLDPSRLPDHVRTALRSGAAEALLEHLRSPDALTRPLGPLFDPRRLADEMQRAVDPGGVLGAFHRAAQADTLVPVPSHFTGPAPSWARVETSMVESARVLRSRRGTQDVVVSRGGRSALLPRDGLAAGSVASGDVSPRGAVSVVVVSERRRRAERTIRSILQHTTDLASVVWVDLGPFRHAIHAQAAFMGEPRVVHVVIPDGASAAAHQLALSFVDTDLVALVSAGLEVGPGWFEPLRARLEDSEVLAAHALVVDRVGLVEHAGFVFPGATSPPQPHLQGHPLEDAEGASGQLFSAVAADALATRASLLRSVWALDPALSPAHRAIDLCARAREQAGRGGFAVEPMSKVYRFDETPPSRSPDPAAVEPPDGGTHVPTEPDRWSRIGLEASVETVCMPSAGTPRARIVLHRQRADSAATPRLRWGIRTSSTPGPWGDLWGDTHFAAALARGLQGARQHVVTYRRGAHGAAAGRLDDVSVVIRGLERATPRTGAVNVLWVISHPDEVSTDEVAGFDLVYAASAEWAADMSARSGREVRVLLQATEVRSTGALLPVAPFRPVFVGLTTPTRRRRIVEDAVLAGVPVTVHGPGWSPRPGIEVGGGYVPNDQLEEVYRTHGLVLADHWPDMARHGFVANRVFDAVAAGALVVSDPVPGIEEMFGGAVRVYRDLDELRELCAPAGRAFQLSPEARAAARDAVLQHHSFHARAQTLLSDALETILRGPAASTDRGAAASAPEAPGPA